MKDKLKKILIVDDASFSRRMTAEVLGKHGYSNIIEAENGSEALELIEKEHPSLVILDLIMPGVGGEEFLEKLESADLKVVIVSAVDNKEKREELSGDMVKAYITKPYEDEDLITAIEQAISE